MNVEFKDIFKKNKPLIISGPCSAETREQVFDTAKRLKNTGEIHLLRAGIWKPRTRPNSFEGVGIPGLDWLIDAGKTFNLPTTTEVANAHHVEECLKKGVDILWIGARTIVNPFAVQEISDSLKGVDIPVFVKNPLNPDLGLWIGAIERIQNTGITNIAAIHRGFSSPTQSKYRNKPMWEIPIALKTEFPDLPIICDPSHIGGTRDLILPISQRAIDLDFDGLMIESHIDPDEAWSDAMQQVTPESLKEILNNLTLKSENAQDPQFNNELEILRNDIDEIDEELLRILSNRMKLVEKIGSNKKTFNITPLQLTRWMEILESRTKLGKELNLSDEFVSKFFKVIHQESLDAQTLIVEKKTNGLENDVIDW